MDLGTIKKGLEKMGYKVTVFRTDFIVAGTGMESDPELGINVLKKAFNVSIVPGKIVLEYGQSQIPKKKDFSNIESLFEFLKTTVPLQ